MDRTSINISKGALAKLAQVKREMSHIYGVDLTHDEALWRLLRHWDATKPAEAAR